MSKKPVKTDYTRDELIAICERAFVPMDKWRNRDSANAQRQLGGALAYLRAGVPFRILADPHDRHGIVTDEKTIWVEFYDVHDFSWFEGYDDEDEGSTELDYLPTPGRLDRVAGGDWY